MANKTILLSLALLMGSQTIQPVVRTITTMSDQNKAIILVGTEHTQATSAIIQRWVNQYNKQLIQMLPKEHPELSVNAINVLFELFKQCQTQALKQVYEPKKFSDYEQDIFEYCPSNLIPKNNKNPINVFFEGRLDEIEPLRNTFLNNASILKCDDTLLFDLNLQYIVQTNNEVNKNQYQFQPIDPRITEKDLFADLKAYFQTNETMDANKKLVNALKEFIYEDEDRLIDTINEDEKDTIMNEVELNNEDIQEYNKLNTLLEKDNNDLAKRILLSNSLSAESVESFFERIVSINKALKKSSIISDNTESLEKSINLLPNKIQKWFLNPEEILNNLNGKNKEHLLYFVWDNIGIEIKESSKMYSDLIKSIAETIFMLNCCYADAIFFENIIKDQGDNSLTIIICGDAHRQAVQSKLKDIGYITIGEKCINPLEELQLQIKNLMYQSQSKQQDYENDEASNNSCDCEDCIALDVETDKLPTYELTDGYRNILPTFNRTEENEKNDILSDNSTEQNEDDDTHCNNSTEEIEESTCELN